MTVFVSYLLYFICSFRSSTLLKLLQNILRINWFFVDENEVTDYVICKIANKIVSTFSVHTPLSLFLQ